MGEAVLFAAGLATFYAAHNVADHVFGQTDKQAADKAKPGFEGWSALLGHVVMYHTVMLFMLVVTISVLDLSATTLGIVSAILFSAVSHAVLDRRWPVKWILEHTGSSNFAKMTTPLVGMYLGDQGLHYFCLWIAALLFAVL